MSLAHDPTTRTADQAAADASAPSCRLCSASLRHSVVDLGMTPLCESYRTFEQLEQMEPFYPLHLRVCDECWLVQLPEYVSGREIFGGEYAYFSSYSQSWLDHARAYCDEVCERLGLNADSRVIEVASNDGYLLQYFQQRNIPVLGIEPAGNVAAVAVEKGIATRIGYLGRELAGQLRDEGHAADLVVANNVLAHVPDLNDFVAGLALLMSPTGTLTLEFPHLCRLIEGNQFDTIYHEHFSYLSLHAVGEVLGRHGLSVFDVQRLSTHGGSLRVWAAATAAGSQPTAAVDGVLREEQRGGYCGLAAYQRFAQRVADTKCRIVEFLIDARRQGRRVAGYGAPGKGNTLLNYCGVGPELIEYTVDRNPYKQGKYLPGTRIPIHAPDELERRRPDILFILPWNLRDEIARQMAHARDWGCRFVVPIPDIQFVE